MVRAWRRSRSRTRNGWRCRPRRRPVSQLLPSTCGGEMTQQSVRRANAAVRSGRPAGGALGVPSRASGRSDAEVAASEEPKELVDDLFARVRGARDGVLEEDLLERADRVRSVEARI